ncbi:hypothetical protein HDU97_003808 [Phlyctochytrium planicorne]|nr:hypothetical protein HDU97_003808 [Phlyctochytrium planicorne]
MPALRPTPSLFVTFIQNQFNLIIFVFSLIPLLALSYLALRLVLGKLSEQPYNINPALAAAIAGTAALEVRVAIGYGFERAGYRVFCMELPSAAIAITLSSAVAILGSRFAPTWSHSIFLLFYAPIQWLGGTAWRWMFIVVASNGAVKPSLKLLKVFAYGGGFSVIPIVGSCFTYALTLEASRAYPDSVWASLAISVASYIVKYIFLILLSKFEAKNFAEKVKQAQDGGNTIIMIGLTTPLRLFRFMKATKMTYAQILEITVPRCLALGMATKHLAQMKAKISDEQPISMSEEGVKDIVSTVSVVVETQLLKESANSAMEATQISSNSIKKSTQQVEDINDIDSSSTFLSASSNPPPKSLPTLPSNRSTLTPIPLKIEIKKVKEAFEQNANISLRESPYEYIRRDLCFADQASNLISLLKIYLFVALMAPFLAGFYYLLRMALETLRKQPYNIDPALASVWAGTMAFDVRAAIGYGYHMVGTSLISNKAFY